MKSSLVLLSGASMALAGPLGRREANPDVVVQYITNVVTEVDYYTVMATVPAAEPTPTPAVITPAAIPVVTVTVPTTSSSSSVAPQVDVNVEVATTSSSSTTAAAAASSPTDFDSTALYHHNVHRANNSASDLTYDDTYAGYAATLAARCTFAHDVTIGNPTEAYGQNIAMYAATDIDTLGVNTFLAQSISDMWVNAELPIYPGPYGSEPDMTNFEAWGHYTQVVWKDTQKVGCAVQKCAAGTMEPDMASYFSVCNYFPAGNVDTEYGTNVGAPLGQALVAVS